MRWTWIGSLVVVGAALVAYACSEDASRITESPTSAIELAATGCGGSTQAQVLTAQIFPASIEPTACRKINNVLQLAAQKKLVQFDAALFDFLSYARAHFSQLSRPGGGSVPEALALISADACRRAGRACGGAVIGSSGGVITDPNADIWEVEVPPGQAAAPFVIFVNRLADNTDLPPGPFILQGGAYISVKTSPSPLTYSPPLELWLCADDRVFDASDLLFLRIGNRLGETSTIVEPPADPPPFTELSCGNAPNFGPPHTQPEPSDARVAAPPSGAPAGSKKSGQNALELAGFFGPVGGLVSSTSPFGVVKIAPSSTPLDLDGSVEEEDCLQYGCPFVDSQFATVKLFCPTTATIPRATTTTNADGNYSFTDVGADGEVCKVEASKTGFLTNSVTHTFDDALPNPDQAATIQLAVDPGS